MRPDLKDPSARDALFASIGLDPRVSRFVRSLDSGGAERTWHVLDTAPLLEERGVTPRGTLLAVHGNPTWSILFRSLVAADLPYRVVAVDQLDMGLSERTGVFRRLQDRITDLSLLTDALRLTGPVIPVGHDWGGVVAMGWALDNPDELAGLILTNTAIHQDLGDSLPAALGLATTPFVLRSATSLTPAFLDTTLSLARGGLPEAVREAYRAPYRRVADREGIYHFVADIPYREDDPSRPTLERLAAGVRGLTVPTLMLWGPRDIVFGDRYLDDLMERLPQAQVHRFENASHLVWEDEDVAGPIGTWLEDEFGTPRFEIKPVSTYAEQPTYRPLGLTMDRAALDPRRAALPAVIEMGAEHPRSISWSLLARRTEQIAAGLLARGIRAGDRVSLLVPPGADLTAAVYALLRIGAVAVVADAGLGTAGLTRATVGSRPKAIIGIEKALVGARALGWPGERISATPLPAVDATALGVSASLVDVARDGALLLAQDSDALGDYPDPDSDAAILFTSGSTGPAKGAVYTHRQLSAMFTAVASVIDVRDGRGIVAGFAPFALLGPALGIPGVVPDMDVTAPATLTAPKLAQAVAQLDRPVVFTAPAALRNLVATAGETSPEEKAALATVPTFLSAGAPVPSALLESLRTVLPGATGHTPYGMTECLVATVIDDAGIRAAEADAGEHANGVCVGRAIAGVDVAIDPLGGDGRPIGRPTHDAGTTGEVMIRAAHVRDRYDKRWIQTRAASRVPGFHATGDVGHLDPEGRLWIEGRVSHVITAPTGPLTPVAIELAAERVPGIARAGAAGVGPSGTQQVVVVAETEPDATGRGLSGPELADPALTSQLRRATHLDLAAVFLVPRLPTDVRHNSKIDRTRLSEWAGGALDGGRLTTP